MKSIFIQALLLSLLVVAIYSIDNTTTTKSQHHNCVHSKIAKEFTPELIDVTGKDIRNDDNKRQLAYKQPIDNAKAKPMRIVFDVSNLENKSFVTKEKLDYLSKDLLAVSGDFLSRRLSVNPVEGNLRVPSYITKCYNAPLPQKFRDQGSPNTDLYVVVTADNSPSESYLAYATSCYRDQNTGRPVVGLVNFNIARIKTEQSEFEENADTTLHEIIHILAMSPGLYDYFIDENGNRREGVVNENFSTVRSRAISALTTPNLVKFASEYWGTQVKGVELENEGGGGSKGAHFERSQLFNEMMTASSFRNSALSGFTLNLIKDSGWYKVNTDMAEPIFWGKGQGKDFLTKQCHGSKKYREFCNENKVQCTFDYKAYGYCTNYFMVADDCKIVQAYSNAHCNDPNQKGSSVRGTYYGAESACATGNVLQKGYVLQSPSTKCYKKNCANGKVSFTVGSQTQTCSSTGEKLTFSGDYQGYIICPDYESYCQSYYDKCPNSCSNHGYCNDGKCECSIGWGSEDCSKKAGCSNNCSMRGTCNVDGSCTCDKGFSGNDCSKPDNASEEKQCKDDCNKQGTCNKATGQCECAKGYSGISCEVVECPNKCSGKGSCNNDNGQCSCNDGWEGEDCSQEKSNDGCPSADSKKYEPYCADGVKRGYCDSVTYYSTQHCPKSCCEAEKSGFKACPENCNDNGQCDNGKCYCSEGWEGNDCSKQSCPNNCNDNGQCSNGKCYCENGWEGEDCSKEKSTNGCPSDDKFSSCPSYAAKGYCKYNSFKENYCQKSCCSPKDTDDNNDKCASKSDKYSSCPRYAEKGYCKYNSFKEDYCQKSCCQ